MPSPSGRYFVDQYSTPTTAPIAVVRDGNGRTVQTVETADISRLEETGWVPPVPFEAKGRGGDLGAVRSPPVQCGSTDW